MSDPAHDRGDHGRRHHPGHGQGAHRPLRRGAVLEALGVDYIDESEVLTPADEEHHIDKHAFKVPFVCGCRDLGEALRRISEGAAMIRTKGEAGTGNIVEAVRHIRAVLVGHPPAAGHARGRAVRRGQGAPGAATSWSRTSRPNGKLPVVNFVAGGIATPADAALVMQLGAEGVFVGSGIFKSEDPARMAHAIVQATTHFDDPKIIADVSQGPGRADAGHRDGADRPRASAWPFAAGERTGHCARRPASADAVKIGVLAVQGAFAEHIAMLRADRRRGGARCACRPTSRASSGLILPGGESTAMRKLIDRWGLRQPILRPRACGRAALRDVRRHDPAVAARSPTATSRSSRCSTSPSSATRSGASSTVRGGARRCPSSATSRSTRVFIRAPIIERVGPGRRRPRAARRRPRRGGPRGQRHRHRVPSRARRRDALPPPGRDDGRRARRPRRGQRPAATIPTRRQTSNR